MPASPERGFELPPLIEMAVSIMTSSALFDPYDMKGVHDSFRNALPRFERQPPITVLTAASIVGAPPLVSDAGLPIRWWLSSEDGHDLLQLQETFLAVNWRRDVAGFNPAAIYPGYDTVAAKAKERVQILRERALMSGAELPSPAACEVLYSNLIPLHDRNGESIPLSEVLAEYKRADKNKQVMGFQMAWNERIDALAADDASVVQVQMVVVGVVKEGGEVVPFVKLDMIAGAVRESWDECFTFFDVAHAHIRSRFMALTTERAHASWLPR